MITLLTGDCREIMPDAAYVADEFDMIIADPPYGDTSLAWDKRVAGWERVAHDCLKPTGSLWLFGSLRSRRDISPLMRSAGFKYAQDIVWEKHNGSGFHADRFKRVHEHIVQFYRDDSAWADVYNDVPTTADATARTVRRKTQTPHTRAYKGQFICLRRRRTAPYALRHLHAFLSRRSDPPNRKTRRPTRNPHPDIMPAQRARG